MKISNLLKAARLDSDFESQSTLAEYCGISQDKVSRIENGKGTTIQTLDKLFETLFNDFDEDDFMFLYEVYKNIKNRIQLKDDII